MNNKTGKVILAFLAGQAVQVILHTVAMNTGMWDNKRISFCIAGGVLVLIVLIAGVLIASDEHEYADTQEMKTYLDYAEIPDPQREEVLNLFEQKRRPK